MAEPRENEIGSFDQVDRPTIETPALELVGERPGVVGQSLPRWQLGSVDPLPLPVGYFAHEQVVVGLTLEHERLPTSKNRTRLAGSRLETGTAQVLTDVHRAHGDWPLCDLDKMPVFECDLNLEPDWLKHFAVKPFLVGPEPLYCVPRVFCVRFAVGLAPALGVCQPSQAEV